ASQRNVYDSTSIPTSAEPEQSDGNLFFDRGLRTTRIRSLEHRVGSNDLYQGVEGGRSHPYEMTKRLEVGWPRGLAEALKAFVKWYDVSALTPRIDNAARRKGSEETSSSHSISFRGALRYRRIGTAIVGIGGAA
ncbi:unnamed protein product, partial [Tilletia controversa]